MAWIGALDNGGSGGEGPTFEQMEAAVAAATATTEHPRPKLYVARNFITPSGGTPSTGGEWARPASRLAAGYSAAISTKPRNGTTPTGILSGAENGWIDALCDWMMQRRPSGIAANGCPCYYSWHHEAESGATVDSYYSSPNQYGLVSAYIYTRMKNRGLTWRVGPIFSSPTLATPTGVPAASQKVALFPNVYLRPAREWMIPMTGLIDYIGVDYYNYRGSVSGTNKPWCDPQNPPINQGSGPYGSPGHQNNDPQAVRPSPDGDKLRYWYEFGQTYGATELFIGEMASYMLNPAAPYPPSEYASRSYVADPDGPYGERRLFYSTVADFCREHPYVGGVCIYDRDYTGAAGRLTGGGILPADPETIRAWAKLMDPPIVEPPPPPPPPPPAGYVPGTVRTNTRILSGG